MDENESEESERKFTVISKKIDIILERVKLNEIYRNSNFQKEMRLKILSLVNKKNGYDEDYTNEYSKNLNIIIRSIIQGENSKKVSFSR